MICQVIDIGCAASSSQLSIRLDWTLMVLYRYLGCCYLRTSNGHAELQGGPAQHTARVPGYLGFGGRPGCRCTLLSSTGTQITEPAISKVSTQEQMAEHKQIASEGHDSCVD